MVRNDRYTFVAPRPLMEEYEKLYPDAGYSSRSDAIRAAISDHIGYMKRRMRNERTQKGQGPEKG